MTVTRISALPRPRDLGRTLTVRDPFAQRWAGTADPRQADTGRDFRVAVVDAEAVAVPPYSRVSVSWAARTPRGTWLEIQVRAGTVADDIDAGADANPRVHVGPAPAGGEEAAGETAWSDWLVVARWSTGVDYGDPDNPDWHSHSVSDQAPWGLHGSFDDFTVDEDQLGGAATRVQVRAFLFAPGDPEADPEAWPQISGVSILTTPEPAPRESLTASPVSGRDIDIALPQYSQRLLPGEPGLGDGGVWCSATSLSMVIDALRLAGGAPADPSGDLVDPAPDLGPATPSPAVPPVMRHVWDYSYRGAGNWTFNASYAASLGYDAFLDRVPSMAAAEDLLAAGHPLVAAVQFTKEDLPEAGYETGGHLLVITGLTPEGDVRVHDPAAKTNDAVRRVYPRAAFERAWIARDGSGGLVYRVGRRA